MPKITTCAGCPRRATCTQLCDRVRRLLPSPTRGDRHELPLLYDLSQERGEIPLKHHLKLALLRRFRSLLTPKQWEVVELYYGFNLSHQDIARMLGLERSAVTYRLIRANRIWKKLVASFEEDIDSSDPLPENEDQTRRELRLLGRELLERLKNL